MPEIAYEEAVNYVNALPAPLDEELEPFPELENGERLVFTIAANLFKRLKFKNPRYFLDGIFLSGKEHKRRDFGLLKPLLNGRKRVLDAGCGWGGLSHMLAADGQEVWAVDHVYEHAVATKLRCRDARVFCASALDLSFLEPETMDLGVLMGVIEHVGSGRTSHGFSGPNAMIQYQLIREISRVTVMGGGLFLNTGNAFSPRDGETNRWFYHWLPVKEQAAYNDLASMSVDNYWLLTWEELSLMLRLCGYETSSVQSPDAEGWISRFVDNLDQAFEGLDATMKDMLRGLIRRDPRYFSSWNLVATKKRPVAAPDEMDFAAMAPNVNYLPYGLLLSQYEEIKRRMQGAGQFPVRLRDLDECVESRPAWIWGAGRGGCKALPQLQAARIEISGFIDSDPTKCGSHFMGLPVAAPDFIARSGCKAYVFIASIHAAAIERQLESYGFRRIRDYFTIF